MAFGFPVVLILLSPRHGSQALYRFRKAHLALLWLELLHFRFDARLPHAPPDSFGQRPVGRVRLIRGRGAILGYSVVYCNEAPRSMCPQYVASPFLTASQIPVSGEFVLLTELRPSNDSVPNCT